MKSRNRICAVECSCKTRQKNGVYKRAFARTRHARNAGKGSERKCNVNIFKIVFSCAYDLYELPVALSSFGGNFYFPSAGQEITRNRAFACHDLFRRSASHDFSAVYAGARPYIDNVIRFKHRFFVVLYDNYGVSEISQTL